VKLYTFEFKDIQLIGAELNERLVDVSAAHAALLASQGKTFVLSEGVHPLKTEIEELSLPSDMLSLLKAGPKALDIARQAIDFVSEQSTEATGRRLTYDFKEVRILVPIPRPGKILCAGVNYRGHLEENPQATLPEEPFFFSKLPSVVIGPGEPIIHPKMTQQLDYEVELAAVIGQAAHKTPEDVIMSCIAGYTILHDVSARDIQFKDQQVTLGKNFDTFAPMGPCLVTTDELPEPGNLRLRSLVNGQVMQDSSTVDWVFPLPKLLSFLSHVMTLEPGDVVSTGTPAGVGAFQQPPVFLKPGDVVTLEIEGIGRLENPVVAEG